MMSYDFAASPLQIIVHPLLLEKQITLSVKREDLLHPYLQGNKWRKLKYNLVHFEAHRAEYNNTLLTFGGAFSNHIYATAAAAAHFGIQAIGIIRGERVEPLNTTLAFAERSGMRLHFVGRAEYRLRGTPEYSVHLKTLFGAFYEIAEGGSNRFALQGVAELVAELPPCDYVATAAGTGATAAGLAIGAQLYEKKHHTLAFAALKKADFLRTDMQNFCAEYSRLGAMPPLDLSGKLTLFTEFHGGGYAKQSPELQLFIQKFQETTQIPIEHVYTGKLFFGLWHLIENNYFPPKTNIIALHTGGLR